MFNFEQVTSFNKFLLAKKIEKFTVGLYLYMFLIHIPNSMSI